MEEGDFSWSRDAFYLYQAESTLIHNTLLPPAFSAGICNCTLGLHPFWAADSKVGQEPWYHINPYAVPE